MQSPTLSRFPSRCRRPARSNICSEPACTRTSALLAFGEVRQHHAMPVAYNLQGRQSAHADNRRDFATATTTTIPSRTSSQPAWALVAQARGRMPHRPRPLCTTRHGVYVAHTHNCFNTMREEGGQSRRPALYIHPRAAAVLPCQRRAPQRVISARRSSRGGGLTQMALASRRYAMPDDRPRGRSRASLPVRLRRVPMNDAGHPQPQDPR